MSSGRGRGRVGDELFVAGDGLRLAVRVQRPTVGSSSTDFVLLHGGYATLEAWTPLADLLADHATLVSYDLRGHGRSGDGPFTLEDHAADLAAVIDAVGARRPALVGVSLGAYVALTYLARGGTAAGFMNVEGPARDLGPFSPDRYRRRLADWPPRATPAELDQRVADAAGRGWLPEGELRKYRSEDDGSGGRLMVQRPSLEDAMAMYEQIHRPVLQLYGHVGCPTTVVLGARFRLPSAPGDLAARERYVEPLRAAAARDLAVHWLDTGHDVPREAPRELARLITEYFGGP